MHPYTAVCHYHGGALKRVRRAAAYREAIDISEKAARAFLSRNGYGMVDDPVEELAAIAGEAIAMKNFFRSQIEELRYSAQAGEQLRAEVALYERALDRCMKALEVMAKLNISERRTKIAEAQAVLMTEAIKNILNRLDLTPAQRLIAGSVVPEELRAITAASVPAIPEPEGDFVSR
jgi:hypothetical protein